MDIGGVDFNKKRKVYRARVSKNGVQIFIGEYSSAKKAAIAYNDYVISNMLEHTLNNIDRNYQ